MTWKENPYIIGRPIYEPGAFFGREELLQFITDNLSSHARAILIHGQRRIGKSSVLRQIPNFVRLPEFVFVGFDLQDQSRLPLSRVLYNLAEEIGNRLALPQNRAPLLPLSKLEQNPNSFDREYLRQLYHATGGKKLVLLLDEFDVLGNYNGEAAVEHFFPYLQHILSQQENLFIIAVIGRRLDEIPRLLSMFKGAPHREIGLLDEPSAKRLITKPTEGVLEYGSDAIQAILKLSAGHPYFTQLLCHALYAHARDKQQTTITRTEVDAIVDKAIENGEGGLAWFRDGLPIAERVIFSAMAEMLAMALQAKTLPSQTDTEFWRRKLTDKNLWNRLEEFGVVQTELLRRAEEQLLAWGFLAEMSSPDLVLRKNYSYKVTIELVRRWLLKRHPLRQAMQELQQLVPEAQQLYEQGLAARQRGEILSARELYAQALQNNPNHFGALLEMAATCLEAAGFGEAVELYTRAYRVDPIRTEEGLVQALVGYGNDLLQQGKFELAKAQFTKALALEPNHVMAQKNLERATEEIRRALARQNPFVVGRPLSPAEFVGRERELRNIFSAVLSHNPISISGERRMGKTSLLHQVASPEGWRKYGADASQAFIIYIDCQAFAPFSPARLWQEILLEFKAQAEKETELNAIADELLRLEKIASRDFRKLLQAIGKREQFLVLIFDEFEAALQPHATYSEAEALAFLQEMRSLVSLMSRGSSEGMTLSYVLATRRRPSEVNPKLRSSASPLFNIFSSIGLKAFDEKEVEALLAKMPEAFALNTAERSWLDQIAGGHPYLLQAALCALFQLHVDGKPFDVKDTTQKFAGTVESFFRELWNDAAVKERLLLMLIALRNYERRTGKSLPGFRDYALIFNEYKHELRDLEERGLLSRRPQQTEDSYALLSAMMEWWIIKELEARHENESAEEAKSYLKLFDRQHAEQLRETLQSIRQNKVAFHAIDAWRQPLGITQ